MNEVTQVVVGLLVTQVIGAVILVAVIKNDLKWIKYMIRDHEERLRVVERHVRSHSIQPRAEHHA